MNRDGSGERKHKGGWIGEVVDKEKLILGGAVFIGPEDPLLLL